VTPEPRRILIAGAGALGTVYGAHLARAGADVQLLARRPHAEAIQASGHVTIEGPDGRWQAPLRAEWRPDRVEPVHTLVLLTKSHDTEGALADLRHLLGDLELAVSLQNGVEKDQLLSAWCGADRVIGGMSMVGATQEGPALVRQTLAGATYLGELPAGLSPRVGELGSLLETGGMAVVLSERIVSAEWSKLVHASPVMSLTTLSREPFHRVLLDERLSELYVLLLGEGAAVAAAAGVELDDLPGMFPVRTLASAPTETAVAEVRRRGRDMAAAGNTEVRISMLTDMEGGRRLELDAVQGFLVAEAARRGVPVPVSEVCLELLRDLDPARARESAT
jgi:2-dehydropantoate 2-reductase